MDILITDSSPFTDLLMYMLIGFSGSSDSKNRSWAVTSDDICSVTGPCMQMMRSCSPGIGTPRKRDEKSKHAHPHRCPSSVTHHVLFMPWSFEPASSVLWVSPDPTQNRRAFWR